MKPLARFFSGTRDADPDLESGGGEAAAPSSERKIAVARTAPTRRRGLTEKPPDDDVCPICFGSLEIPCQALCGHWYCASCILQYWNFSAALQPCKCPMCSRLITKLMPEASLYHRREVEIRKVLEDVGNYNRMFLGGISGYMLRGLHAIRLYIRRRFHQMLYDDPPIRVQNILRVIALFIGLLYTSLPDFLHIGDDLRYFDYAALGLSFIVMIVGAYLRYRRNRNIRELANMHDEQV